MQVPRVLIGGGEVITGGQSVGVVLAQDPLPGGEGLLVQGDGPTQVPCALVTGAAFWYLDGLMKGYQYRYYVRMREIEYTTYLINHVTLGGEYGDKESQRRGST